MAYEFNEHGTGRFPFHYILIGAVVVFALVFFNTTIYTVQAESQGVVLRFGRYLKTVDPGLRFKMPFGIDRVTILPVQRQLKQEFGFSTPGASNPAQYSPPDEQEAERTMVTGDLNAASVEWVVQYRIEDPKLFMFHIRNPESTLRDVSESTMRAIVGDRTVDEVITIGREEIKVQALALMQELVHKYEMGITIEQVLMKNINPPVPVQPSFNEVNQAQQEREKVINQANGEYNREVPKARGEAAQKITAAEGYATKRINEAEGDAARFSALFAEYVKAPEVTRQRLYLETMKEILPTIGSKIILDQNAQSVLPLLQLDRQNGSKK